MPTPEQTSWSMVLGAAAGAPFDREAFSIHYAPAIRAYLAARWHLPVEHDAVQDATSDTFLELFKENGALSRVERSRAGGFRAYLYGIVRLVAAMAERRFARRRERLPGVTALDHAESDDPTLSRVFDRAYVRALTREARDLMAAESNRSPAAQARVRALQLQVQDGKPPREIAVAMEVPVERVYELLKEARREFRATLLRVVASHNPDCPPEDLEARSADLLQALQ